MTYTFNYSDSAINRHKEMEQWCEANCKGLWKIYVSNIPWSRSSVAEDINYLNLNGRYANGEDYESTYPITIPQWKYAIDSGIENIYDRTFFTKKDDATRFKLVFGGVTE